MLPLKGRYQAHEEKKTDINIAITLLVDAVADKFDTVLILSGDSDLAPVTTKLKELCPGKKIGIIVPQNQSAMNLKQHADFFQKDTGQETEEVPPAGTSYL